jgi:hypothetical protein
VFCETCASTCDPFPAFAGVNHSQFAGGEEIKLAPDAPPLDLQPDVSHGEAVQQVRSHFTLLSRLDPTCDLSTVAMLGFFDRVLAAVAAMAFLHLCCCP